MRCRCCYLSGASCRLFAYGPADVTAIPKPRHLLPRLNPDWLYLSGTGLPRLSWKKRPLNGCSSSSSSSYYILCLAHFANNPGVTTRHILVSCLIHLLITALRAVLLPIVHSAIHAACYGRKHDYFGVVGQT